jgi:hypothetical protein
MVSGSRISKGPSLCRSPTHVSAVGGFFKSRLRSQKNIDEQEVGLELSTHCRDCVKTLEYPTRQCGDRSDSTYRNGARLFVLPSPRVRGEGSGVWTFRCFARCRATRTDAAVLPPPPEGGHPRGVLHPRRWVDVFKYSLHRDARATSPIPPTAVGGCFQALPTSNAAGSSRIPPTAVGGYFRSSLHCPGEFLPHSYPGSILQRSA